jgi:hypothetical protein
VVTRGALSRRLQLVSLPGPAVAPNGGLGAARHGVLESHPSATRFSRSRDETNISQEMGQPGLPGADNSGAAVGQGGGERSTQKCSLLGLSGSCHRKRAGGTGRSFPTTGASSGSWLSTANKETGTPWCFFGPSS